MFEETGCEDLKNYIWAIMGKAGYEETLKEFNEKVARIKMQPVLPE